MTVIVLVRQGEDYLICENVPHLTLYKPQPLENGIACVPDGQSHWPPYQYLSTGQFEITGTYWDNLRRH
jgi:hypothetical protein